MAHIFFERLEKRQSTQNLFPASFGDLYITPPDRVKIALDADITQFFPEYGVNLPSQPTISSGGGYFPWGGTLFGMSGYSQYNPISSWTNPSSYYNPWGSWGSGNFSTPIWNIFGGLFGGRFPWSWRNNNPGFPDFRILYGIPPTPQPYYGVSIPTPPTDIITFYGMGTPNAGIFSGTGIFY